MKIFVAIPCMNSFPTETVVSLTTLKQPGEVQWGFLQDSLVYDARNRLATMAVEAESDYVLWLDSDMVFKPGLIEKLLEDILEKDCDVVTGIAFRKRPPYNPAIWKDAGAEKIEDYVDYPDNELFEVGACGMACCLMKTSVLAEFISEMMPPFQPIAGYGEDISFCLTARARFGFKIFCDSRIKVGHVTSSIITEPVFKAWRRQNDNAGTR